MKPKAKKPAPADAAPRWHVEPFEWPEYRQNGQKRRRVKVLLICNGEVAHEGHCRVCWRNCQELAERYNRAAMILRPPPPKVLADYPTPEARARAARRAERKANRL